MAGLVAAAVVVLGIMIVLGGIVTAIGRVDTANQPYDDPYPTASTPEPDPTTEEPEPEPTEPEPTRTAEPKEEKPPHLRKQKGREVVPLPDPPSSIAAARQFIKSNPVYGEKVANAGCDGLPEEMARPYGNVSDKTWRKVAQTMADCARDMWAKPLARAGYQATYAEVVIFEGSVDSPCGVLDAPGVYCSANQVIYLNKRGGGSGHPTEYHWMWHLMTMAHEYGHHAQARTGLLYASWMWQESQDSDDAYWRVSRRKELQANCFGGMALRRSQGVSRENFELYASNLLGEGEHGSAKNQYRWYLQGWLESEVRQCNTFAAAGKDVR